MVTQFDLGNCFPGNQIHPLASGEEFPDIPLLQPYNSRTSPLRQVQRTTRNSRTHPSTSGTRSIQDGNQLLLSENDSKCDARKSGSDWPSYLKRKASSDDEEERLKPKRSSSSRSSPKKSHSVCEKRYRTKLNVKITALRESIPHLHLIQKAPNENDHDEKLTDRRGYIRDKNLAARSDKATTISKAIEYISFLEMTNKRLTEEGRVLRSRAGGIEHPIAAGSLVVRNGVIILKDYGILGI
jgi:Helix-loop-helix DNA-binding domain